MMSSNDKSHWNNLDILKFGMIKVESGAMNEKQSDKAKFTVQYLSQMKHSSGPKAWEGSIKNWTTNSLKN